MSREERLAREREQLALALRALLGAVEHHGELLHAPGPQLTCALCEATARARNALEHIRDV